MILALCRALCSSLGTVDSGSIVFHVEVRPNAMVMLQYISFVSMFVILIVTVYAPIVIFVSSVCRFAKVMLQLSTSNDNTFLWFVIMN